jgi:hypothetical protein
MLASSQMALASGQGYGFGTFAVEVVVTGNGQVSQAGHNAGTIGFANGGAVFVPVPVADPVEAIFDGPVASGQAQEGGSVGPVRPEAGQEEDRFLVESAVAAIGPTVQPRGLCGEGEVDLGAFQGAANQSAFLQPAMALFNLSAFRGKKRSGGAGAGGFDGGRVGCL